MRVRNGFLVLIAGCVIGIGSVRADEPMSLPVHEGTQLLRSGELVVEVADPTADQPYNTGVRFSPVGLVLRARYRGHSYFWSPIPPNAYSGDASGDPAGTIMEFDLGDRTRTPRFKPADFTNEFAPPGFQEARPSSEDPFLKIGVGILQRNLDGEYRFIKNWKPVERATTTAKWSDQRVTFKQSLHGDANGYQYALEQDVSVRENRLNISSTLKNTGDRTLITEQYHHNFLQFDDRPVGPGYRIDFPCTVRVRNLPGDQPLEMRGNTLAFTGPVTGGTKPFITCKGPEEERLTTLTVRHTETAQALTIGVERPDRSRIGEGGVDATGIGVFASNTEQLSPEMFVTVELPPGKEATWVRTYLFSAP